MADLQKGNTGKEVENLQVILAYYGYNPGSIDKKFGEKTEKALIAFQKANGLTGDGKVGSQTKAVLNKGVGSKGAPCYVNVSKDPLNLRPNSNGSGDPIGSFRKDELIFIRPNLGSGQKWVEVLEPKKSPKTGWVKAEFLKPY